MPNGPLEFRDYVQARWPALVRYGFLLTGDQARAEDLVQTALERCWRRWARIRTDRPDVYVRRAMAREAISGHRARSRRVTEQPLPGHLEAVDPAGEDGADGRAARTVMWAELSRLPVRMRAVVVLRLWEDLSEHETAAVLGCSTGSVKSQLSRAMARLRGNPVVRDLAGLTVDSSCGEER